MPHPDYPALLAPLDRGRLQLRNRVVITAHSARFFWTDPRDTAERQIAYTERRAAGGVGFLIHDTLAVAPCWNMDGAYALDHLVPKLQRLAQRVKPHGTTIVQQLFTLGAQTRSDNFELAPLWSFSGSTTPEGETAHPMTADEVEAMAWGYARCARMAVQAGLDGVELHAAHGYLLQQSFSPWANRRSDAWGEPLRFLRTVIARVREALGPKGILGLRLCLDDLRPLAEGGVGTEGLLAIARTLAEEGGIDYFNHSEGSRVAHYTRALATWRHPQGEFLPLAARLKQAVGAHAPVIGVGRITRPEQAEEALQAGQCDLVGMTRAHIADPDLVRKIAGGERARLRLCVGANQGCSDRTIAGYPITCLVNPEVGREYLLGALKPAATAKRVLVVGGGPAGLKAAEIAARRGHRVTLVERSTRLGGRLRHAAQLSAAAELAHAVEWLEAELALLGVRVLRDTPVDAALIARLRPDAAILATGATPQPRETLAAISDGSLAILSPDAAMDLQLPGQRILVLDRLGNHEAVFAAEHLAQHRAQVTVCSPRAAIGAYTGMTHLSELPAVLGGLGCTQLPNHDVVRIQAGRVTLRCTLDGREQEAAYDALVAGVPPVPESALAALFEEAGIPVQTAGDAHAPRSALQAFREGDAAGRAV